jgi:hypothetical protein
MRRENACEPPVEGRQAQVLSGQVEVPGRRGERDELGPHADRLVAIQVSPSRP